MGSCHTSLKTKNTIQPANGISANGTGLEAPKEPKADPSSNNFTHYSDYNIGGDATTLAPSRANGNTTEATNGNGALYSNLNLYNANYYAPYFEENGTSPLTESTDYTRKSGLYDSTDNLALNSAYAKRSAGDGPDEVDFDVDYDEVTSQVDDSVSDDVTVIAANSSPVVKPGKQQNSSQGSCDWALHCCAS